PFPIERSPERKAARAIDARADRAGAHPARAGVGANARRCRRNARHRHRNPVAQAQTVSSRLSAASRGLTQTFQGGIDEDLCMKGIFQGSKGRRRMAPKIVMLILEAIASPVNRVTRMCNSWKCLNSLL